MIHVGQKKRLGVRPVAWVMKRKVLPVARLQGVVSGHDAFEDNRCGYRFITLPDKIFTRREFPDFASQPADRSNVGSIKVRVDFKLSQKNVAGGHRSIPDNSR
jgi:hypothetical protein